MSFWRHIRDAHRHHHHFGHHGCSGGQHPPFVHGPRPHCRGARKLFVRIYAHAVFLLLMVFASMFAFSTCRGGVKQSIFAKLGRYTGALCQRAVDGGKAERAALERFARYADAPISCFAAGGKLKLRVGKALPPIDASDERALAKGESYAYDTSPHRVALPIRNADGSLRGYALVGHKPHATVGQIFTALGVVLIVLAFGSWPLVKFIVSPIGKLTETINRVAEGDLSARTGITRRDEVGQLATAFDEMVARLEALVSQERELIANVSHELRTPLARIRVALELAEEGNDEEARRYIGDIAADLGELEALVSDLLTSARLDLSGGADAMAGSAVLDANDLANAAAARFGRRFANATLELTLPDAGDPAALRGDEVLLRRVLDNLLSNAHQHGGGERIELSVAASADRVRFSVRDHGAGIEAADLPRIFEPFFRGERSRSRELGGVGLGLALCKRIVEAHGGSIDATSEPGDGTTVTFSLPAVDD